MSDKEAAKTEPVNDSDKLDKFKLDIINDADVTDEQRDQANEDMRFINVTGGMWEGFLVNDFTPDRVKMEFDIVSNFLNRFLGEWDQNRVGVEFKPDDGKTSDEDSELLNGIYRADFRNFSGSIATDNAVDEASTCGYGAMKLATIFEDDEDPENDNQRIEWRPIYNSYNSVFWDQAAQRIDKKDARWCTILKTFTRSSFKDAWPGESAVSAYVPDSLEFHNQNVQTTDLIYIATRYEVIERKESVFVYNNLRTGEVEVYSQDDHDLVKDELKADDLRNFVRERQITRKRIEKTVFSGEKILRPTRRIAGKWIPIIPFYGYRSYVDGVEWARGLVRKLKDAARLFNMQVSQLAENAASSGQEMPIFYREQVENSDIQKIWKDRNNKPYMVIDAAKDEDGNIVQSGPVGYLKPPQLDGSTTALLSIVPGYVQDATGGMPQETFDPAMSGKALNALIKRENLTTRKVSKNISDAIMWSGEVYQAMAAEIYNTQRIIRTIGKDGNESSTLLLKTVLDSETGKMVETNTLRGKKFRSYPDVGPQYETLREQTVEDLKGMLDALKDMPSGQKYSDAIIAVLLENITGVGLDPIKDLNRKFMLVSGLIKPETEEEEALVQQAQQPKEDPQQKLIEAATQQQLGEAQNLGAGAVQKVSDAKLKDAKTIETIAGIELDQQKLGLEVQKQLADQQRDVLKQVSALPVN